MRFYQLADHERHVLQIFDEAGVQPFFTTPDPPPAHLFHVNPDGLQPRQQGARIFDFLGGLSPAETLALRPPLLVRLYQRDEDVARQREEASAQAARRAEHSRRLRE